MSYVDVGVSAVTDLQHGIFQPRYVVSGSVDGFHPDRQDDISRRGDMHVGIVLGDIRPRFQERRVEVP
jgi:hypothetical protein